MNNRPDLDHETPCGWGIYLLGVILVGNKWFFLAAQQPALPLSEVMALQSIYEAAGGTNWSWKEPYSTYGNPWNFTDTARINPCQDQWQGITCEGVQPNHVSVLSLENLNLVGYISTNISALASLRELRVSENELLSGPIPSQIGNLTQLQELSLNLNVLTGWIPPQIGHLKQLQVLNLYSIC